MPWIMDASSGKEKSAEIQFLGSWQQKEFHPQLALVDCRKETNCQLDNQITLASGQTVQGIALLCGVCAMAK